MKPTYFTGVETEDENLLDEMVRDILETDFLYSDDVVMSITFDESGLVDLSNTASQLESVCNAFRQFTIRPYIQPNSFCIQLNERPLSEKQIHMFGTVLWKLFSQQMTKGTNAHLKLQYSKGKTLYDSFITPNQPFDTDMFIDSFSPLISNLAGKMLAVIISKEKLD